MLIFIYFLFTLGAFAQPVITPSTPPVVAQGTTYQFTADRAVTWSLATGSVGSINSSTGVYTAPTHITPKQQMAGCQLFPNDHIFNTRIDALPAHANSDDYVGQTGWATLKFRFARDWPLNVADNSTPLTSVTGYYYENTVQHPIISLPQREVENGAYAQLALPSDAEDHHIFTVQRQTCVAYEQYQWIPTRETSQASSVTSYSMLTAAMPDYGTGAAGMPMQPTMLRASEIRSGTINHAFAVSVSNAFLSTPSGTMPSPYVWPAQAYSYAGGGLIPFGTRMRLKSSFDTNTFCAGKPSTTYCATIVTALKNYGIFIEDGTIGGIVDVTGDTDIYRDPLIASTIIAISYLITADNLEAVDQSTLQDTYTSGITASKFALVPPALGSDGATVIATGSGGASGMHVILQAATVGFPAHYETQYIQAGASTSFTAYVTGVSGGVTWSMSPSVGTLNASTGEYFAPSSVSLPTSTTITATSITDSQASASFVLTVFPDGNLYVDLGGYSFATSYDTYDPPAGTVVGGQYVDPTGRTWWNNLFLGNYDSSGGTWYAIDFANTTGYKDYIWYTQHATHDSVIRAIVQPGIYSVTFLLAQHGVTYPTSKTDQRFNITLQNNTETGYSVKTATNNTPYGTIALTRTATVADGNLFAALRVQDISTYDSPRLAGLILVRQTAAPRKQFSGGFSIRGGGSIK